MAQKLCLALDLIQFLSNVPEILGICMTLVLYAKSYLTLNITLELTVEAPILQDTDNSETDYSL